jgi:hypothetical protein
VTKLCILVEGIEEGSRLLHWLNRNILAQAGITPAEYTFVDDGKLPLLLMCKSVKEDKLMPEYLGLKSISDYHGSIAWRRGRLIGITFHPASALANPNMLPVLVREITNLLRAAERPNLLDRPDVAKCF